MTTLLTTIISWCAGDPCDPCKKPTGPGVKTTPNGWYGIVVQADHTFARPDASGSTFANVYVGADGLTSGDLATIGTDPGMIPPSSRIIYTAWLANDALHALNWDVNTLTFQDAYDSLMQNLARMP